MITKRIIPCLDVRDGRVVKGVNFEGLRDVSSPVELGMYYSSCGADELVFYDITASADGRKLFTEILCETAKKVFIPLTVGGGINTVADFDRVLKCGADKVSVNSGAIRNLDLVGEAAKLYGDQCVVLSVDGSSPRAAGRIPVWKPLNGSSGVLATVPVRSWSIPSIPTVSKAVLTWKCWTRCVTPCLYR